jgi:hypothetical protein
MATRKMKSEATPAKARAAAVAMEPRPSRQAAQPTVSGNPNHLLREAAWNRMFGRVEVKNPFTR